MARLKRLKKLRKGFRSTHWFTAFVFAIAAGFATFFFFNGRTQKNIENTSLRLARQVADQTEALFREASSHKDESDPLAWAAKQLSLGAEPRLVRVVPAKIPTSVTTSEVFELDWFNRRLDYAKVFSRESGEGVRIYVDVSEMGLAGIKDQWAQDFFIGITSLSVFLVVGWYLSWRRQRRLYRMTRRQLRDQRERKLARAETAIAPGSAEHSRVVLARFTAVMKRVNEYSFWAERAAKSFVDAGYDDPREVLFQAQRLYDYLVKLHQLTDRGQNLLEKYNHEGAEPEKKTTSEVA